MKLFKNNQSGRSMIEMLGVLAIIGVLSIGGIAGYSKAMFKYKMNKTLDIVNNSIHRLIELENSNIGDITISGAQNMLDYGIVSDCDTTYGESTCAIPLGYINYYLVFRDFNLDGSIAYVFTQHQYESCVAFLNSKFYKTIPDEWFNPSKDCDVCERYDYIDIVGEESSESFSTTSNLTTDDVINMCQVCKNTTGYCYLEMSFRPQG